MNRLDLIDGALRAPEPGAPFAYFTTKKFLPVFGLATLRDLPDIERLEDEGLLQRPERDVDLDGVSNRLGAPNGYARPKASVGSSICQVPTENCFICVTDRLCFHSSRR